MKNQLPYLVVTAVLFFSGCKKKERDVESTPPGPVASVPSSQNGVAATPPFAGGRKTSFQEVTSQLDPGGSLFLYLATDQWLTGLSSNITQIQEILLSLPGPGDRDQMGSAFHLLSRLVKSSGVEDVTGVGVSAAPVAPGLFRNKMLLHHPVGAGQGFLWSMFGRAPHALHGLSMLPTNTALAAFGDLDVKELWQVLERELSQSGIPDAAEAVASWPKTFEAKTKIPWAGLLASLGGEAGTLLTLDETKPIELPMGRGARVSLPAPGLLIAAKVSNTLLYDRLSAELQANPKTVTTEQGGWKICSMPLPIPIPIPIEVTLASSGEHFYFATSPELVRTVQAVLQGNQPALKNSVEFQSLARHVPSEGNQFIYVASRLGETFAKLQEQAMGEGGLPTEQLQQLQQLFGGAQWSSSLAVGAHTATGWQTTTVGNRDSASAAILLPTVGVTAVGAGLLLPALAKAKSKAQSVSSVNQLKQLGLAARLYANDRQEKFPNAKTWSDDLKDFVGSEKTYKAGNDPKPRRCSYAYNAKLSEMEQSKIDPRTVLFFETDEGDWNQSGGPELLLRRPRSGGNFIIGLADGSVQQVVPARLSSLRWEP